MIPWYVFKKNRTKNTWSLESSVSIILQKIEIAFYCEKYSCRHFDHVIMIQGNRKLKKIDIQTIFFSRDCDFTEPNFTKFLTNCFEKLHPLCL